MLNPTKLASADVDVCILIDCFIKCKTSLKIEKFDVKNYFFYLFSYILIIII